MSTARKPWYGSLIALLAVAAAASAPSLAAASPAAHHRAGWTTAPAGAAATRFARRVPSEFATGDLRTVEHLVLHGGYVAAGIGMRNLGHGTLVIKGIPVGAKVVSAILMWDILGDVRNPSFAQGRFGGHAITGTFWAAGRNPCWSFHFVPLRHNFSFEADVTSFVKGNGRYKLAGFASGQTNGRDPFRHGSHPPMAEGATLIVIYQLTTAPKVTIQVAQGAFESQHGRVLSARLSGFTARRNGSVKTTYVVSDGQIKGNKARFNGHTLSHVGFPGAAPQAVPRYRDGDLWDTVSVNVTSLVKVGATSATMAVVAPKLRILRGGSDCIVWVGQVLSVRVR